MNIKEELLENHSVAFMKKIKKHIGNDSRKFDLLMKLSLSKDPILAPRASWAAMHCGEKNQSLFNKWIPKMVDSLNEETNSSVKRNFLRLLQDAILPEKYRSNMFDIGLKLLFSKNEPIAVKAFAMTVLTNIVHLHPELKIEMETIIREMMHPLAPPAIIARGKKSLKSLSKLK